ncbi:hypothetical protein FJY71_02235, partial [candidate division WOR-3 bacterium]|nr:hypothetical protein [candidate division WOR-3 bacterium]
MLSTLRKRVRVIMFVVAGTFVAGFLLGEVWRLLATQRRDRGGTKPGVAGEVGRREVSLEEYRYNRELMARKYQGDSLFRDMTTDDEARIDMLTWSTLSSELVWAELLRESKLRVTEGELDWLMVRFPPEWLRNRPELLTDGQFDTAKYVQLLQNPENRMVFADYARDLYQQLRQQKLQIYAASAIRPVSGEIEDALRQANSVRYVTWLQFSGRSADAPAAPTDAEAREYYRTHPDEFSIPKEVREVRFAYFPLRMTARDSAAARERMELAHARLRGAADTASLRDSFDMAMFTDSDFLPETSSVRVLRTEMEPAAESAVRRLSPGGYTQPVPGQYGWQIVRLDSTRADTFWVRRIRSRVRADNAAEIALGDTVRQFIDAARTFGPESAAAQTGVPVTPMPLMLVDGRLTQQSVQFYAPGQLEEWARQAGPGDVMEVPLRGPGGMYVFMLADVKPAGVRPWDAQVQQAAAWRLRQEQDKQAWTLQAAAAIEEIRAGKPLEQYAG